MNLSENILKKIKKSGIKPRPRWQFVLFHALLWSVFVFSILLGGIAFAVIIRFVFGTEWDVAFRILPRGRFSEFLMILPYIWISALTLVLFLSRLIFLHTKNGYRFRPVYVVLVSLFISLLLGIGLYFNDTPARVEEVMRSHIPPYNALQNRRDRIFHKPEDGVVVGRIIEVKSDSLFLLNAMTGETWTVSLQSSALPLKGGVLSPNLMVMVIGDKTGEDTFEAEEIRLWKKPGMPGPPPALFFERK